LFFVTYGGVKLARVVVQGTLNEGEGFDLIIDIGLFWNEGKKYFSCKKDLI
jgi:hypothetical protein